MEVIRHTAVLAVYQVKRPDEIACADSHKCTDDLFFSVAASPLLHLFDESVDQPLICFVREVEIGYDIVSLDT